MCGIAGAWLPNEGLSGSLFNDAVDVLTHRGPDDKGVFQENGFYLGMRRLAIIDLQHGQQPQFDETKNGVVVFNGEIYNYIELMASLKAKGHHFSTSSDTEVIVHSMEEGEAGPKNLRGMFAYAYLNRSKRELTLVRDRVGVKPLYYYDRGQQGFLFASEIKAIKKMARDMKWPLTIANESVYHYLSLGSIPQCSTIYQEIKAVPPASKLILHNGNVSIRKYWDYEYQPKIEGGIESLCETVQSAIEESVRLRLRSDVPMGIFLSGGLDSSIVAYEASVLQTRPLQAFTVSFPEYPAVNEADIAAITAKRMGMEHHILPLRIDPLRALEEVVNVYDQPFADPSALPSLGISKLASEHVKVVLNGDGGDEQFAGYRRYMLAKKLKNLPNLGFLAKLIGSNNRRRSNIGLLQRAFRLSGLKSDERYIAYTTDMLSDEDKNVFWKLSINHATTTQLIQREMGHRTEKGLDRLIHLDRKINLLSGLLVKMDMASSAYGLEARSPFLDHTLFELSSKVENRWKVKGNSGKWILKKIYDQHLPKEVLHGKKRGFEIPLDRWLSNEFRPLMQDVLQTTSHRLFDYMERKVVESVFNGEAYKLKNRSYIAYSILVLAMWLDSENRS